MSKLAELKAMYPAAANRRLLEWLSDDDQRADLYQELGQPSRILAFQSQADSKSRLFDSGDSAYRQTAYLLTGETDVRRAFGMPLEFGNAPFGALGGGTFMLGLDPGHDPYAGFEHAAQRAFAKRLLQMEGKDGLLKHEEMLGLITAAFQAGVVGPLKARQFDLAEVAEQVALRYMSFLFGFPQGDHALLEQCMRQAYRGLCYQVMGRHFTYEPLTLAECNGAMGTAARRIAELIGLYRSGAGLAPHGRCSSQQVAEKVAARGLTQAQLDELDGLARELGELRDFSEDTHEDVKPLKDFTPLLARLTDPACDLSQGLSDAEMSIVVVGLVAGAIGNIQASVCIALRQFFRLPSADFFEVADRARVAYSASRGAADDPSLAACVWEALRLNPPVAFLPRRTRQDLSFPNTGESTPQLPTRIPAGSLVLLGIGGATRGPRHFVMPPAHQPMPPAGACPHAQQPVLVFGGSAHGHDSTHSCVGQYLAMPLIVHLVRQMLVLPGLAEACNARTGHVHGLRKRWGYACESYPLEFRRDAILTQSPLSVVMQVKQPLADHAEKLKAVIKYGAPSIEKKLRDSKHVHFAWFQFFENDSKLALFTVYDRDFDSYIEHFALEIGPLFDRIFEHIQDAPPLPVNEYPKEFVDTIRRFNRAPAGNYFFSAYPNADASMVSTQFKRKYP